MSDKQETEQSSLPAPSQGRVPSEENDDTVVMTRSRKVYFSGPLPPPEILAQYNQVISNGADRILAMAERQGMHREEIEKAVVMGNLKAQERGSYFAFILALLAIVGGIFLIYTGKSIYGLITMISSLVGLISVFLYSQRKQNQERAEKAKALEKKQNS